MITKVTSHKLAEQRVFLANCCPHNVVQRPGAQRACFLHIWLDDVVRAGPCFQKGKNVISERAHSWCLLAGGIGRRQFPGTASAVLCSRSWLRTASGRSCCLPCMHTPICLVSVWRAGLNNWRDVLLPAGVSQAETTSKFGNEAMHTHMKDPDKPAHNMDRRPKWKLKRRSNTVKKRSDDFVTNYFIRQPCGRSTSVASTHVPVPRKQLSIKQMLTHPPRRPELHPDHPG